MKAEDIANLVGCIWLIGVIPCGFISLIAYKVREQTHDYAEDIIFLMAALFWPFAIVGLLGYRVFLIVWPTVDGIADTVAERYVGPDEEGTLLRPVERER